MIKNYKQHGFTLIELIMAMAFLTFMLLFVVTALTQLMATYNKGLVYKSINQAGRTVLEEISRSVRAGSASSTDTSAIASGRLCTGGKAYVWNIPSSAMNNRYGVGPTAEKVQGIVRLDDTSGTICLNPTSAIARTSATIIVDSNVAVRTFDVVKPYAGGIDVFNLQLTTADYNCKPGSDGNFCASVRINTAVSIRNLGGGA
jgi:prepilin-type N-terminal cleavage/methylation domain-containing protein